MSYKIRYTKVIELIDDSDAANKLIDGEGWDLLKVATRKREIADNTFTDEIVYVVGHREDAQ